MNIKIRLEPHQVPQRIFSKRLLTLFAMAAGFIFSPRGEAQSPDVARYDGTILAGGGIIGSSDVTLTAPRDHGVIFSEQYSLLNLGS